MTELVTLKNARGAVVRVDTATAGRLLAKTSEGWVKVGGDEPSRPVETRARRVAR